MLVLNCCSCLLEGLVFVRAATLCMMSVFRCYFYTMTPYRDAFATPLLTAVLLAVTLGVTHLILRVWHKVQGPSGS